MWRSRRHTVRYPRTIRTNRRSISDGPSQVCSPGSSDLGRLSSTVQYVACLEASGDPKVNTQMSWLKKAVCLGNPFPAFKRTRPTSTDCFTDEATFHVCVCVCVCVCVEQPTGKIVVNGEVKALVLNMSLNVSMIHRRSTCGGLWWKRKYSIPFFLKHFTVIAENFGCCGEYCSGSCPCGNSFPVRWCTIHLSHCVLACLEREFPHHWIGRGGHFLVPSCPRFHSSGLSLLGVRNIHYLSWKSRKYERVVWENRHNCRAFY